MKKKIAAIFITSLLLCMTFFVAIRSGSIAITYKELLRGLFVQYDERVAIIYDLRFPRIIIAMLGGAALSVSGVLFQAVMKNPLADPGIIGISSGASFVTLIVTMCFPQFYFISPILACLGGMVACILVYSLSWKSGLNPLRLILVGIAINSLFTGLEEAINSLQGSSASGVASIVNANISMKTWDDVWLLLIYVGIGLLLALCCIQACNLLGLEDKTARGLGVNVHRLRIIVSFVAVILASMSTAVMGVISFIGLVVPHISRLLVGSNHKWLIPYSMLLGSLILLFADTAGRLIAAPYEISPGILCAIVGGPCLIALLRRSEKIDGN